MTCRASTARFQPAAPLLSYLASAGWRGFEPLSALLEGAVLAIEPPTRSCEGGTRTHIVRINNASPYHSATSQNQSVAEGAGLEPAFLDSKSNVLPLDDPSLK